MKTLLWNLLAGLALGILPPLASAQVNSGSNGSDGAFNPTQNVTINMADHPTGIYQYTSVNIPAGVTVTFTPNANNTPVVWLVQGDCVINGGINVSGQTATNTSPAEGGAGGWPGGNGGSNPTSGQGPGGGIVGYYASNASYGNLGVVNSFVQPGATYGNTFILPLRGGSGGSGIGSGGRGGGGGAILIAASNQIRVNANGNISARGGQGRWAGVYDGGGGAGSCGAIRLIAASIAGAGAIDVFGASSANGGVFPYGGHGRIRFDTYQNSFAGTISGNFTQGFQPIILPTAGQGIQLEPVMHFGGRGYSA